MRKNFKAKMCMIVHKIGEHEVDEKLRIKEMQGIRTLGIARTLFVRTAFFRIRRNITK